MKRAEAVTELEQRLVIDGEQGSLERRKHRQLIVGPFDRGERGADRLDFLAPMKRLPADEQMRDTARFDGVHVLARDVLAEADEPAEQQRDVTRLERHSPFRAVGLPLADLPAMARLDEPRDERPDSIRQRLFNGLRRHLEIAAPRVRPRHRQGHDRRLRLSGRARRRQRHVFGLRGTLVGAHLVGERGIDEALDRRHAPIAGRQLQHAAAARGELLFDPPVRFHARAAETVNRLFWIADDEQLARDGAHGIGIGDIGIGRRQEQQDLGLHRIRILKLVHEDSDELLPQVSPDRGVASDERAGPGEEIGKVERAGGLLELLVSRRRPCQFLLERRGQVAIGVPPKLLQIGIQQIARTEHHRAGEVLAVLGAEALARPRQAAIAHEIDQARFPSIEIHLPERLFEANLLTEAADGGRIDVQIVALGRGTSREVGKLVKRRDQSGDLARTIERRSPPRTGKIAPLRQRAAGRSQTIDRAVGAAALEGRRARPPQRPPQALGRTLQRLLQPGAKRARVETLGLRFGQHREQRIDAGLDRPLAKQLGAEAVNGVDVRVFERRERALEPLPHVGVDRFGAVTLQGFAQAELQFARRFLGEGDRHDLGHRRPPGRDGHQDAVHQLGRLPGARRRFDNQRLVERIADRASGVGIRTIAVGHHQCSETTLDEENVEHGTTNRSGISEPRRTQRPQRNPVCRHTEVEPSDCSR